MKILAIRVTALVLLLGLVPASQAATSTTTLHIEGMTCSGCATAVKLVLQKTPGVISAEVSYEEKRAAVEYDASKTTPAKIALAVTKALSYKVTVVDRSAAPSASSAAAASCAAPISTTASAKTIALAPFRANALRTALKGGA